MTSLTVNTVKPSLADEVAAILGRFGVDAAALSAGELVVKSPISGETLARVNTVDAATADEAIENAHSAFLEWRLVPAPKRGELIRLLGEELRATKGDLGRLVSIEVGKQARASPPDNEIASPLNASSFRSASLIEEKACARLLG